MYSQISFLMDISSQPKFVHNLNFKFILGFRIRKLNEVKREGKLGVTKKSHRDRDKTVEPGSS